MPGEDGLGANNENGDFGGGPGFATATPRAPVCTGQPHTPRAQSFDDLELMS